MQKSPVLFELVGQMIGERKLSRKTGNAYLNHIRRFADFFENRDLAKLESVEIGAFINHLQAECGFADATRNQALSALLFFYREVLGGEGRRIRSLKRLRKTAKIPVFFTDTEAKSVLARLNGAAYFVAALIYGSGLRLSETLNLRVGDVDFARHEIVVRDARSGAKLRTTFLPASIIAPLQKHLEQVRYIFEDDCQIGFGKTFLPAALRRKFPDAETDWRWQFVFPACKLSKDEAGETFRRYHLAESTVQKAINEAIRQAKICKQACSQTLRHSFAVRLVEKNCDVHLIQHILGHKNLKSTLAYTNLNAPRGKTMLSPLDC